MPLPKRQRHAKQPIHRAPRVVDAAALRWPTIDEAVARTLPPVLRAVVKALGWGGAREFLTRVGGLQVYVPEGETSGQTLGLGRADLARLQVTLAPHLSNTRIVALPKADKLFLRWRDEEFARDMHSMSNSELARKNKLSVRQVLNLKKKCTGLDEMPPTQPGQAELF